MYIYYRKAFFMAAREKRQTMVLCIFGQTWEGVFSQEKIGRFPQCKERTIPIQERANFFIASSDTRENASLRQSFPNSSPVKVGPESNQQDSLLSKKVENPQKLYYITPF